MNRMDSKIFLQLTVAATLVVIAAGNVLGQSKMPRDVANSLREKEPLEVAGLLSEDPNEFPFEIVESRFVRKSDDKPVFLNIIGYQPLEPGQELNGEIHEKRVKDDLRRWRAYQGGTDPIVLRVYPGPTQQEPNHPRMPKCFYDGVRELGFWIIRDIYFEPNCADPNAEHEGYDIIDAVLAEVNDANAFDRIFAWEIGDELEAPYDGNIAEIKGFVEKMCAYIKKEIGELNLEGVSDLVTWGSWAANDPLFTAGAPIEPNCLDYISYSSYSYDPERMRDHQPGSVTGTPYQGYLAALKERYPNKPLVISETGLADNNSPEGIGDHPRLYPWYPAYRKGALTSEQVAEGLADRYWDARLLRDEKDPNIVMAGLAVFEWNDEWHKYKLGSPAIQEDKPEEHFGLGRFEERPNRVGYQLRYKFQQETIRDLYTLKFRNDPATLEGVAANTNILRGGASIKIDTAMSETMAGPMRYRWEASRGYIVANGASAEFYPDENVLGPARITTVAIDADSYATATSSKINIEPSEPNGIEILTFGIGADSNNPIARASGRVCNVNLDECKLVCYLYHRYDVNDDDRDWCKYDAQPYQDRYSSTGRGMKSIWVDKNGYWWTPIFHDPNDLGELYCWLVHKSWTPIDYIEGFDLVWTPPPEAIIAEANTVSMDPNDYNDVDNDLLPDYWEVDYFGNIDANDRYDDPDGDLGNNLEEFLRKMDPTDSNDDDNDGLWDHWEYHYFGDVNLFDPNDDPDGDGLTNLQEQDPNLGTHPGRASQDRDQDGLPDLWEMCRFANLSQDANENFDGDCFNNLDEYELGLDPTSRMADLDLNCDINFVDYSLFASHWLNIGCNDPNWCDWSDLDKSGEVNYTDLYLLTENWLRRLY